jgi:hypothetical protein
LFEQAIAPVAVFVAQRPSSPYRTCCVPLKLQVAPSTAQRVHPVLTVVSGAMREVPEEASLSSYAVGLDPPQAARRTAAQAAASDAGVRRWKVVVWRTMAS